MLWNGYGIIIFACCCSLRWVPVVMRWFMVYLLCFNSLCLETLWTCKRKTVEGLCREGGYSGIGYSGGSSGVYSGGGHGGYSGHDGSHTGRGYTRRGCSKERYADDGQGYSAESGCYRGSYGGYVGKENDIKGYDKKGAGDGNLVVKKHMLDKEVVIKNVVGKDEDKK